MDKSLVKRVMDLSNRSQNDAFRGSLRFRARKATHQSSSFSQQGENSRSSEIEEASKSYPDDQNSRSVHSLWGTVLDKNHALGFRRSKKKLESNSRPHISMSILPHASDSCETAQNNQCSTGSIFSIKAAPLVTAGSLKEAMWIASLREMVQSPSYNAEITQDCGPVDPFRYLSAMFPTERHEVRLLSEPVFGSAYTAYIRYLTVQKVCDALGLDMQSQTAVTSAGIMCKDVIHWTGAQEGTFANHRKDIRRSEELRLRLGRASSLTAREASLKLLSEISIGALQGFYIETSFNGIASTMQDHSKEA
ncbi:uncharacterized protein F5891DRAFT_1191932 [Suillus fuscotomentosus]|uniref:Uncharacterized protein n=1 Tax=Suillus fuscotomentosus TaxID=1912939 RepID=A0AAD4E0I8_9AGAM|nr:uncharacterized protein F5891DRAFT_1191932 [Suillus fuscotomentosus]KAG1897471.1 hypothetical protein F5891DRAFT_1191932 [Suillus fuscotomentosus]